MSLEPIPGYEKWLDPPDWPDDCEICGCPDGERSEDCEWCNCHKTPEQREAEIGDALYKWMVEDGIRY